MSKKKKNKRQTISMSEDARSKMLKFRSDVRETVYKGLRNPDNPHDITLSHLTAYYAEEGFKEGYDVGRREEREKAFNLPEFIEQFGNEVSKIARKYGLYFHVSGFRIDSGCTHPCCNTTTVDINCFGAGESIKEAFLNWKD